MAGSGPAVADVVLPEPSVTVTRQGIAVSALTQPDGKVLVGGSFTSANGAQRLYVARFMPDGTLDAGFSADPNSTVYAVAVAGDFIYIGGNFSQVGGQAHRSLARLSLATGVVDAWTMDADDQVQSLLVDGNNLYVGGWFTVIGGAAHGGLARINLSTGLLDSTFSPNFTGSTQIPALAVSGGNLYAGGLFTAVSGQPRANIARLNTATGALDPGWSPAIDGYVQAIAADGAGVYVGGSFSTIGGVFAYGLARINASNGTLDTTFAPGVNSAVYSLALVDGELRAAGAFAFSSGTPIGRLARFNLSSGAVIAAGSTDWSGYVQAVAQSGNTLFAVGAFTTAGGVSTDSIALIDAASLAVDATRNIGLTYPGTIYAMSDLPDGSMLIGGNFNKVNGKPHRYLAQFNSDGTLNPGWTLDADSQVNVLLVNGNDVYAGGYFSSLGGVAARSLARINYVSRAVDPLFLPRPNNAVVALAYNAGLLYAGGFFTSIGGRSMSNVARMDAATGNVDAGWAPNPDGDVNALLPVGGDMFVAGLFANIGGQARNGLARISGITGQSNTTFNSDLAYGTNTVRVNALVASGDALFMGGLFTSVHGVSMVSLAKVDSEDGSPVPGFTSPLDNVVYSLAVAGDALYVGGNFSVGGDASHRHVAKLNVTSGGIDTAFGGIARTYGDPIVFALTATTGRIWLGGQFDTFGGLPRNQIASFGALVPQMVKVYEFFAPTLNHYFRTANADEAFALIANPALGFNTTDNNFSAWSRAAYPADAKPVDRFYGSLTPGPNSHFYTAEPAEFAALRALEFVQPNTVPRWNFEEIAFAINQLHAYRRPPRRAGQGQAAPTIARCRVTPTTVTHRSRCVNQMLALGWSGEGVVMCALA